MLRRVLDRESLVKSNLTDCLVDCVKELQLKNAAEKGRSLTNDESTNTLCWVLEAVFIHGLKSPFLKSVSSVLGSSARDNQLPQPSFWEFVLIFCHQEVIVQINSLSHINTDIGRCRSWLRLVLNDGLLISYVQLMLTDKRTLKNYYNPSAFLRDAERCDIMKSYLYGIESYDFQLASNSSLLNSWNSAPLSLVGLWTPADTVIQGVDVVENMDAKDLQALPTLRNQANTPPKPSFFPYDNLFRTPLLEEDEALRVILSSKGSTTSSAARSSGLSSRRSSDQHSPEPSLSTLPQASRSEPGTSEQEPKKLHSKSHLLDQNGKKRTSNSTERRQNQTEPLLVPKDSEVLSNDPPKPLFLSSTPINVTGETLSSDTGPEELSRTERVVSSGPMSIPTAIVPTPDEETSYAALFQSYNKSDTVIGTPITVGSFFDSSKFGGPTETTVSSDPALGSSIEDNHSVSFFWFLGQSTLRASRINIHY